MGTRTYSRRAADGSRVLTALGRARAGGVGAAILDIFGDVIGDDGLPTTAPAVVTVPPPTATTPPVTPPTPTRPSWIGKRISGAPAPLSGNFNDPNDPLAVAFRDAWAKLAANPNTQLSVPTVNFIKTLTNPNYTGQVPTLAYLLNSLDPRESMAIIYEMRGWNEPAAVESWTDITAGTTKTPIMTADNTGAPILFYRGVNDSSGNKTARTSAKQKQDDLRRGREHFVGFGVHGQGTYAAAATTNSASTTKNARWGGDPYNAMREAKNYGRTVVVFGLKKGSNIRVGSKGGGVNYGDMVRDAQKIVGGNIRGSTAWKTGDEGLAAAILGYDAYRATSGSGGGDYWVVLNRSAMVISKTNTNRNIISDPMTGK